MRMAPSSTPNSAARASKKISFEVDAVRRVFPDMAKAADGLRERQHPSEWSAAFSKLLQRAGWPGDRPLNPAEHQTVEHWKNLLSELASLDVVLPRMTYGQALQRLRRIAHDRRFAPRDEGAPVQIMDMLEAAGSQFDALWIAGLHGGVWPERAASQSVSAVVAATSRRNAAQFAGARTRRTRAASPRGCSLRRQRWCAAIRYSPAKKSFASSPLIEALPEIAELSSNV